MIHIKFSYKLFKLLKKRSSTREIVKCCFFDQSRALFKISILLKKNTLEV